MLPKPTFFNFQSYVFEPENKRVVFKYSVDFINKDPLNFTEEIILPEGPNLKNCPKELLAAIFRDIHLILGVSYYKLFCPPNIKLDYNLSKEQADFWNKIYKNGLGEFLYRNNLNPSRIAKFPHKKGFLVRPRVLRQSDRILVGMGGGKESIVTIELLKEQKNKITAFVVETQREMPVVNEIIKEAKIEALKIRRILDEKIFQNYPGSYNGHIPVSMIYAFLGFLTAILYDYRYITVGNEFSSNFGNIKYMGQEINHQWSKSSEAEELFQNYSKRFIAPGVTYFSALRPFYEIRIAKIFSKYKNYFPYFSSCNKNFKIKNALSESLWCGECAKCVFTFTLLSAFLTKDELLGIFKKNLYDDKSLIPLFKDLLGFGDLKPFDCVGTFEEIRAAFCLAEKNFGKSLAIKTLIPLIKDGAATKQAVFKTNKSLAPAKYRFLGMESVALVGFGKEGKISQKYLKKRWPNIKIGILDKKTGGKDYLDRQTNFDFAIKTPGTTPLSALRIPHISATNIFFSETNNITIGITGSKGKSTTASLIYNIFKTAGKKCRLLGNIGQPMLQAIIDKSDPNEIFIIELSSYQLEDIEYSPNIAVITNLFPEHMDYHGSIKNYYTTKKNIINFQSTDDWFVYNPKNKILAEWAKNYQGKSTQFDTKASLKKNGIPLLGDHNLENIQAALRVSEIIGIDKKIAEQAIKNFKGLPHRLEFIGEYQGIKFFDDAISTTPESTIMAIQSLPKIGTIFLGGQDRGYNFNQLEKVIKKFKIKNFVLFPQSGKKMIKSRKGLNIIETTNMEEAVKFAYKNTEPGQICLLSTASPSYSLWKNFEEKGNQFQISVKKLGSLK